MSELISRQAAIIQLSHNKCGNDENDIAVQHDIETIRKLSPAQPLTAYVISDEDGNIKCSNCGSFECWGNYCMNCGAKMRGKQDE